MSQPAIRPYIAYLLGTFAPAFVVGCKARRSGRGKKRMRVQAMTNTGNVSAQGNIDSRDIITGLKIDNMTVVIASLDELSQAVNRAECRFHLTEAGNLEVTAGNAPLLTLPPSNRSGGYVG